MNMKATTKINNQRWSLMDLGPRLCCVPPAVFTDQAQLTFEVV